VCLYELIFNLSQLDEIQSNQMLCILLITKWDSEDTSHTSTYARYKETCSEERNTSDIRCIQNIAIETAASSSHLPRALALDVVHILYKRIRQKKADISVL